jgi:hypothetical protein
LSFEPDIVSVQLDGKQLHLEPGQTVFHTAPIASSPSQKCSRAAGRHERANDGNFIAADAKEVQP